MERMKQCCKCTDPKPISEFSKSNRSADGFATICREHASAYNKAYMLKWRKKKREDAAAKEVAPVTDGIPWPATVRI